MEIKTITVQTKDATHPQNPVRDSMSLRVSDDAWRKHERASARQNYM